MRSKKKKILIADDSQTVLMYLGVLLKRLDYTVVLAENGVEALKLLKLVEPDIVILDVMMETMDGIATLRRIKEDKQTAHIPVIMLTVDSSPETIARCKKLGCFSYLLKPVKVDSIHEALQECIYSQWRKKRKHVRADFREKVVVTCNGENHKLYTESLSEGGVYLRMKDPFPVGSEVEVALPLKDRKAVTLKGEVIYTKGLFGGELKVPPGAAIEFKGVREKETKILRDYVEELLAYDILDSQEEPVIGTEKN
ncbi:MAG: response regulator [Thermodesulfovibrionales bacterium]|nr:response regulator [Thermodesulfovibrionales bacterium]